MKHIKHARKTGRQTLETTHHNQSGLYNYFDERVFSHTSNGVILAVRPQDIELFETRKLGTIPATVKEWEVCGALCRVLLSIQDRSRETVFYADLPAQNQLVSNLSAGMILYMRFAWDKVMELKQPVNYGQSMMAAAA